MALVEREPVPRAGHWLVDGALVVVRPEDDTAAGAMAAWQAAQDPQVIEPAIRVITPNAFIRRLDQATRIAIRASSDPIVQDFLDLVRTGRIVPLDDAETIQGVDYLVAQGLLTSEQRDALLADGTPEEVA